MDDIDVASATSAPASTHPVAEPYLLSVAQAAAVLGIGRSFAYELVHRFIESGGAEGIPVVRLGRCWRVPRPELFERIHRDCIDTSSGVMRDELAARQLLGADGAGGPTSARRRVTIQRRGRAGPYTSIPPRAGD